MAAMLSRASQLLSARPKLFPKTLETAAPAYTLPMDKPIRLAPSTDTSPPILFPPKPSLAPPSTSDSPISEGSRARATAEQEQFVASLPAAVRDPLNKPYGKTTTNISFIGEIRFRHVIPHLVNSGFLCHVSMDRLSSTSFLVRQYNSLLADYAVCDPTPIRGYGMYEHSASETTLSQERIRLSSAALLRQGCNVEKLVRYIGGPHLATHRDIHRILRKLRPSCPQHHLDELNRIFTIGAPKLVNATNTEENFLHYYQYGNHSTVDQHPDIFLKALVKDSRRGNVIILDDRLLPYMPHTHLTPQGLADVDNKWKNPRTIFDSSFRPDVHCMAINDWTDKHNEPAVTYPGSFVRFLSYLWNLRISYPDQPIFLGDDDITNAFRLIKTNPCAVGMHTYRFGGHTIVATGQTFGDTYSPANFEPAAICRQYHARWLWTNQIEEILSRAKQHVDNIQLIVEPKDNRPFASANPDILNTGVKNPDGSRTPPPYPMQVDDCLYADIAEFFPRTVAASVIALEDVFDSHHPYQDPPLSLEKLDPIHREDRLLLGHHLDTRTMMVKLSNRRAEKVLAFLENEGWLRPGHRATITEIARLVGLLDSACEYFPWGKANLLLLHNNLRVAIRRSYAILNRQSILKRYDRAKAIMPKSLAHRLAFLTEKWIAQELWRSKLPVSISSQALHNIVTIYKYIKTNLPWETPIGHIIPRTPNFVSTSDASFKAIGVDIPHLRTWCLLPYGPALCTRLTQGETHINELEFIGLFLAYVMVLEAVNNNLIDHHPHPTVCLMGDNMSANAWCNKMSTQSVAGQNLLKLFAEYQLLSPLGASATHIAGVDNVVADTISRPHELFSPHLTSLHSIPYTSLIKQVCQRFKGKRRWKLFLPSAELLSLLHSLLSSTLVTERPKRIANSGQFVPVESIFSDGFTPSASLTNCSL